MTCPWCNAENREGAAFCRRCGRLQLAACPHCGAPAGDEAFFCDTCGRPIAPEAWLGTATGYRLATANGRPPHGHRTPDDARGMDSQPRTTDRRPLPTDPLNTVPLTTDPLNTEDSLQQFIPRELLDKLKAARKTGAMVGERRVVTMLFCDVKGSTALAEELDPEEWSDIINAAFERMVRPVYRYEGTVARLMGDGLLAFFGAPIAHEDDPRRAVLAALEIVAGVAELRAALPRAADLAVRVGINTGLVVVGAVGSDLRLEYSALGDAINVAARMEQTAEPGTVQITDDTLRLVAGQFDVEPLGGVAVKGKAQPVSAYRVLRRKTAGEVRRFQTAFYAPLVNRAREWEMLRRAFEGLAGGRGGILFLSGEAGLGKTRLMEEALTRLAAEAPGARDVATAAYSYETGQPYGLIVRLLRAALGLTATDPAEAVRDALDDVCLGQPDDQRHALLTLFGMAGETAGPELSGEAFARVVVAALAAFWQRLSSAGPVILALDDLQWADASSVAVLGQLFDLTERIPVLFLCALRRDRRSAGWRLKETAEADYHHRFAEAALYPLTDGESRLLLEGLLGDADLPESLRALILDKAEGNPLFVEEVVHNLIERGLLAREAEGAPWTTHGPVEALELPDSLQALLTARIDRLDEDTRRTLQIAAVLGRAFSRAALAALVDEPDRLDSQLLELQRMELIREVVRLPEPEYAFHHTLTHEATYNTILLRQRRAMHHRAAEALEQLHGDRAPGVTAVRLAHHFLEADAPDRALPYLAQAAGEAMRLHATAEALATYDRALPLAIAQPNGDELIVALATARARTLELESRFADANDAYAALEQLGRERDNGPMQLAALIGQGKLRANVTPFYDAAQARALMDRALTLAQALDDKPSQVRILWNLVNVNRFDLNTMDAAVAHGERGLAMARELDLPEETAYLLNDTGEAYGTLGNFTRANALLVEAQAAWRQLGNEPMLADALTGEATWNGISGNFPHAIERATEALAISERIGNIWGQAYSRGVLGNGLALSGELGRGVTLLRQAIQETSAANFVAGQLLTRAFLGNILMSTGGVIEAERLAREAADIGRGQLLQFMALPLGLLGQALVAQGRLDEARQVLADPAIHVERLLVFIALEPMLARIELALADGQPAEALDLADSERARFAELEARSWMPAMDEAAARALRALGRPREARDRLAAAVAVAQAVSLRYILWLLLARLAAAEDALGEVAAAEAHRREAAAELAQLLENTWPDDLRDNLLSLPEAKGLSQLATDWHADER